MTSQSAPPEEIVNTLLYEAGGCCGGDYCDTENHEYDLRNAIIAALRAAQSAAYEEAAKIAEGMCRGGWIEGVGTKIAAAIRERAGRKE